MCGQCGFFIPYKKYTNPKQNNMTEAYQVSLTRLSPGWDGLFVRSRHKATFLLPEKRRSSHPSSPWSMSRVARWGRVWFTMVGAINPHTTKRVRQTEPPGNNEFIMINIAIENMTPKCS